MKTYILIIIIFFSSICYSQTNIKGTIYDENKKPVFAANVYLKTIQNKGVISNYKGEFSIIIPNNKTETDTLIISYISSETIKLKVSEIKLNTNLSITLKNKYQGLDEVVIKGKDPISEKFSVKKMDQLDIYLNPVSEGDPLKAITALPASTNTDETANPSLRGSSSARSRVTLNGVPVYNPVKNGELNGIGHFSLFNTQILDKQYIYASNPPLTFGNTSAGLVEIETIDKLKENQVQLSLGLANTGLFLSQKIGEKSFFQLFGNYQFSDAFIALNKENSTNLNMFGCKDAGINFRVNFNKNISLNIFSYLIKEDYDVDNDIFTYKGQSVGKKLRNFNVINLIYKLKKSIITINNGTNFSNSDYSFGNILSDKSVKQSYSSFNYKRFLSSGFTIQAGMSQDYNIITFKDTAPIYYYALSPESPNFYNDTTAKLNSLELYAYFTRNFGKKLSLSTGIRGNIPHSKELFYLSYQLGIKYDINRYSNFLLSGGKYHNYTVPYYYMKKFVLLNSYQASLDYSYNRKNTAISAALFYKEESGEKISSEYFSIDKTKIIGLEFYISQSFLNHFKISFSNVYINQKVKIESSMYRGERNLNYFIKSSLNYNNPNLFSITVAYIGRPGKYYTHIQRADYNQAADFYRPTYSNEINGKQYNDYNKLSISISKYIHINKNSLVVFASLSNIFNSSNNSNIVYSRDYTNFSFEKYQSRTVYFGFVWMWNYGA